MKSQQFFWSLCESPILIENLVLLRTSLITMSIFYNTLQVSVILLHDSLFMPSN